MIPGQSLESWFPSTGGNVLSQVMSLAASHLSAEYIVHSNYRNKELTVGWREQLSLT